MPRSGDKARIRSDPPHSRNAAAIAPGQFLIIRSTAAGEFAISPRNRTSPVAAAIGYRYRVLRLRYVKRDKSFAILPMVRPPCMRLGSASPSNPRFSIAQKGGPPASARGHNV